MPYDPDKHHRRSIRLKGYDYTTVGAYFITICTHEQQCLFGEVVDAEIVLNSFGQIAWDCWQAIPDHFSHIQLGAFVVMPNHVHGILILSNGNDDVMNPGRGIAMQCSNDRPNDREFGKMLPGSIPAIIRSFKSATTKQINLARHSPGALVWQRNYYDHILRDEIALTQVFAYIQNNPLRWQQDQLHPNNSSKC